MTIHLTNIKAVKFKCFALRISELLEHRDHANMPILLRSLSHLYKLNRKPLIRDIDQGEVFALDRLHPISGFREDVLDEVAANGDFASVKGGFRVFRRKRFRASAAS